MGSQLKYLLNLSIILDYSFHVLKYLWSFSVFHMCSYWVARAVSSEYINFVDCVEGMSAVYTLNKKVERTDPCGSPSSNLNCYET